MRVTVGIATLVVKTPKVLTNRAEVIIPLGLLGAWPVRPFR